MKLRYVCLGFALFGAVSASHAQLVLVTSRADIGANDSIDWGQFGSDLTTVPSGSHGTTALGYGFAVDEGTDAMSMYTQGMTWEGNFADGDRVIGESEFPGTMNITLDVPAYAFGLQLQGVPYNDFGVLVTAYDSQGNTLGSYNVDGTSNMNGDNSAVFVGVSSNTADIAKISYTVTDPAVPVEFGVNQASIRDNAVPEPGTLAALVVGIGALARRRRRA